MEDDEFYRSLIDLLARIPAIQDATAKERNTWLRDAGLNGYILSATLVADDSPSVFCNKIIGALWVNPADLIGFVSYVAEKVCSGSDYENTLWDQVGWLREHRLSPSGDGEILLRDFLEAQGLQFDDDDLFVMKAEAQERFLSKVFISNVVIHNPQTQGRERFVDLIDPRSVFIFAHPGYGKSSMRMELARRARTERQPPVLVVQIDIMALEKTSQTDSGCLDLIVRSILREFRTQVASRKQQWLQMGENPDTLVQFLALESEFNGVPLPTPPLSMPPEQQIQNQALIYRRDRDQGSDYWLPLIWNVVRAAGFGAIYLFVDRLDDFLPPRYKPQDAIEILQHLLVGGLLIPPGKIAWKFFLNKRLDHFIEQRLRDRLITPFLYLQQWDNRDLMRMFNYRLTFFASRGNVRAPTGKKLLDLCADDVTEELLLDLAQYANGSPRAFIELIMELCNEHCKTTTTTTARIARNTIEHVIEQRKQKGGPDEQPDDAVDVPDHKVANDGEVDLEVGGPNPPSSQDEHLRRILREKERVLQVLELREARSGNNTDAEIVLEIEDLRAEIQKLKQQLNLPLDE